MTLPADSDMSATSWRPRSEAFHLFSHELSVLVTYRAYVRMQLKKSVLEDYGTVRRLSRRYHVKSSLAEPCRGCATWCCIPYYIVIYVTCTSIEPLRQHVPVLFATCEQAGINKYCEWNHTFVYRNLDNSYQDPNSFSSSLKCPSCPLATFSLALPDVLQPHDDLLSGGIPANRVNRSTSATGGLSATFCAVLTDSEAAVANMLYVDGSPNSTPGGYQQCDSKLEEARLGVGGFFQLYHI